MFLNIFNGLVIGLSIKLLTISLAQGLKWLGWAEAINKILLKSNGQPTIIGAHFGEILILTSCSLALAYHFFSKKELYRSMERRFSLRISLLLVTATLFTTWSSNGLENSSQLSFLWMVSLLRPDSIAILYGYPVNLLALLTLCTYCVYVIALGKKRRTLDPSLHISSMIGFMLLSYNAASGFFLFWLIQSLSLAYLSIKLQTIIEPK